MLRKLKGGIYDDPTQLDILFYIYMYLPMFKDMQYHRFLLVRRDVSYNTDRPKEIQKYEHSRVKLVVVGKKCVFACAV